MRQISGLRKFVLAAVVLLSGLCSGGPAGMDLPYGQARELARLKDQRINESSGIAVSHCVADAFWTNNDSGDSPRLFLFGKYGETIAVVSIKGASAIDWEDIASYRFGEECRVLIADVGDNFRRRKNYTLYVIQEPSIRAAPANGALNLVVETGQIIEFNYEDGSHDCEAVAVDPIESEVYLVSKEPDACKLYSMPIHPDGEGKARVARAIADLRIPNATAMDISPDSMRAVILTYGDAYEFSRKQGEKWAQAFAREPRILKTPTRKQGESICYGVDGKTLYLTSEGVSQPLWEVPVIP